MKKRFFIIALAIVLSMSTAISAAAMESVEYSENEVVLSSEEDLILEVEAPEENTVLQEEFFEGAEEETTAEAAEISSDESIVSEELSSEESPVFDYNETEDISEAESSDDTAEDQTEGIIEDETDPEDESSDDVLEEDVDEEEDLTEQDALDTNVTTSRVLSKGLSGTDVKSLQTRLVELGYLNAAPDGIFGAKTEAAVIAFQQKNNLDPDGVVGPLTLRIINGNPVSNITAPPSDTPSVFKKGMSGDKVLSIQKQLVKYGYLNAVPDGIFGAKTEAAVIAFQKANGLTPDGLVGSKTLAILYGNPIANTPDTSLSTSDVLKLGMSGDKVYTLQSQLVKLGYLSVNPDGVFGPKTEAAVIAFQEANGLAADGVAGTNTIYVLLNKPISNITVDLTPSAILSKGMSGDDVLALQKILFQMGYLTATPDGVFGAKTEAAVMDYQKDNGLVVDGVVGPATIASLTGVEPAPPASDSSWLYEGNTWTYISPSGEILTTGTGPLSDMQKATIVAAFNTPTTANGLCAQWVSNVLANAGLLTFDLSALRPSEYSYAVEAGLVDEWYEGDTGFNANDYWAYVCYSSSPDDLQPGMIIASRNTYTYLGEQFGHVGFYIGNNMVISSVGYIETVSLDMWDYLYNNVDAGSSLRWGFLPVIGFIG